jgi:predicted dehydrogenase
MAKITRRSFIKKTTAAAGVGAATVLPTSAWAQPVGANGDIRVAVVGLGGQGQYHVRRFAEMEGVRVVALCDPDRKRIKQAAEKLGNPNVDTYVDYRKLLEDDSIDVISTASCNHWHAPVTIWGCEAGKDIYVEKPVCHTIWEGQQMIKAAKKHNRIVQSGIQLRSDRGIQEGIDWLHEGNLGKILLSRGLCYENRSSMGRVTAPTEVPDHIDYDLWCGPSPNGPLMRGQLHFDWHWMWDTGNGDLGNQGIHQMDVSRRFTRQPQLPPRVISVGGRFGWNDDGQSCNTQLVYYDYDPVPILFEVTEMPAKKGVDALPHYKGIRCGNIVHCEGGYFACGESGGGWAYDNDDKRIRKFDAGGAGEHLHNFIDAVRSRKEEDLHCTIQEGHISSSLCHIGNISHRVGEKDSPEGIREVLAKHPNMTDAFEKFQGHLEANEIDINIEKATLGPLLTLDPDKEEFTGDHAKAANKLLTKKYRKPFAIEGAETYG